MSDSTLKQDALEECMQNCETLDEFVKDCKTEARDYFLDAHGEYPNDDEELVEAMVEWWDIYVESTK